jgi:predicted transposase YbfD/YdcC
VVDGAGRQFRAPRAVRGQNPDQIVADRHQSRFVELALANADMVAALIGPIVRSHWSIENSLHWVMDMMFRDDECRVRTDHAPANFTTIKHMAHNLLRTATSKDSMRLHRKVAAWDDDFLAGLIAR